MLDLAARKQIDNSFGGQGAYALMVVVQGDGDLTPTIAQVGEVLKADSRIASVAWWADRTSSIELQRRRCSGTGRPQAAKASSSSQCVDGNAPETAMMS